MQLNPTLTYLPTILLCLVQFVGMANSWFVIIKIQVKYGFHSSVEWGYALYCLHSCQFGCGILKMVGPKMQDFCPRINMLKGNFDTNYLEPLRTTYHEDFFSVIQKWGM